MELKFFLAKDSVLIGAIVIADTLKDDAKSAIASLKAQNFTRLC